MIVSPYRG